MASGNRPKNKRVAKPHLSERELRGLLSPFRADATAPSAAEPTGLSRDTADRYHGLPRARIAEACEAASPFEGEVEADESRFGARRARGARPGARGKAVAFGPLERGGKAYAQVVPGVSGKTSARVMGGKVPKGSATHADGPTSFDGLVDRGCRHRHRVRRGEDESVERGDPGSRTDGIESLWGLAESRLVKYQGVAKGDFYLHLRERELRLNMRGGGMSGSCCPNSAGGP